MKYIRHSSSSGSCFIYLTVQAVKKYYYTLDLLQLAKENAFFPLMFLEDYYPTGEPLPSLVFIAFEIPR